MNIIINIDEASTEPLPPPNIDVNFFTEEKGNDWYWKLLNENAN